MKSLLDPARFLQAAALLTTPLAVLAPRALAIVLPAAALGAGLAALRRGALGPPPPALSAIMVAALAWGAASSAWAYEPRLVWSVWFQIAGLAAAGLVLIGIALRLDDDRRVPIGMALAIGIVIALAVLCIEWLSAHLFGRSLMALVHTRRPFDTFIFNRGAATIAILVWPGALALRRHYGAAAGAALVVAAIVVILQYDSMAAIVALAAGAAVYLVAAWRPRAAAWALLILVAVGSAAAPLAPRLPAVDTLLARSDGSISISHRLQIWRFAAEAVAEHPVAGWGLNASRDLPGGIDEVAPGARRLPLHPHNALLQIWLELGAVGAALGAALAALAVLRASRLGQGWPGTRDDTAAMALAMTASAAVIALVGYGVWQAWWMAALWLAAAFMATLGSTRRHGKSA